VRQSGTLELAVELAEILNAEYGCTKFLAESGLLSIEGLIGVSGKRISPKIYIALGGLRLGLPLSGDFCFGHCHFDKSEQELPNEQKRRLFLYCRLEGSASREEAAKEVEKVIRQFDPCISCSVH